MAKQCLLSGPLCKVALFQYFHITPYKRKLFAYILLYPDISRFNNSKWSLIHHLYNDSTLLGLFSYQHPYKERPSSSKGYNLLQKIKLRLLLQWNSMEYLCIAYSNSECYIFITAHWKVYFSYQTAISKITEWVLKQQKCIFSLFWVGSARSIRFW